ncbi:hypothetical protein BY458DRAFT_160286 [Sporodiniella umbellata]|nr:hypothetical protein BY458DRAFT_160286 [Sporodiniella umbellata]
MKETELGFLRGKRSRALFEPKHYKRQQVDLIVSIFNSNGHASFDTIENLYSFMNPVDLIKDNYDPKEYYLLNSCAIKTHVKEYTKDAIQSMTSYCDVNSVLPSSLTFEDVSKVIDTCVQELASTQKIIILEGGYVTKPEYAQALVDGSKHYLNNLACRLKQKETKSQQHSPIRLQESDMMKALESVGCPYHISEKILPFIRKTLGQLFKNMMQTPYVVQTKMEGDDWVTEQKAREYRTLTSIRNSIYFNYQSICLFEDETARKSLEKYVLKNQCIEFLYHLVLYVILDQSFSQTEVEKSTSLCIPAQDITQQKVIDMKQQKFVIAYFIRENDHKYDKTSVVEVDELLKAKKLKAFVNNYLSSQTIFKESPLIDNEETRKQANKTVGQQLYRQLEQTPISQEAAPQILHLTSLLLFLKHYQCPLYVSGKFVPAVLTRLEPFLSEKEKELVHRSYDSIVKNECALTMVDCEQLVGLGLGKPKV